MRAGEWTFHKIRSNHLLKEIGIRNRLSENIKTIWWKIAPVALLYELSILSVIIQNKKLKIQILHFSRVGYSYDSETCEASINEWDAT